MASESRIVIPVRSPSFDGRFYGRYPNGDKPASGAVLTADAQGRVSVGGSVSAAIKMAATAGDAAAATAGLSSAIRLAGTSNVRAAAQAALTTGGGAGSPDFVPLLAGSFAGGALGASCTNEFAGYKGLPIVYANDYVGPFGESRIGKVQQQTGNNYYGGAAKLPSAGIDTHIGMEAWVRAAFLFPSDWCAGGSTTSGDFFGLTKFFRYIWDTNYRLTFLMGGYGDASGIQTLVNTCANPAGSPWVAALNSEVTSETPEVTSKPVLTRGTWKFLQWWVRFGTTSSGGTAGAMRAWVDNVLVCERMGMTTRPTGTSFDSVHEIYVPGDYWNGGPVNNNPMFISQLCITQNPPSTSTAGNRLWVPHTLDVRTLQ